MAHDWMIDVLADLRRFAQANGLTRLAERIEETEALAAQELAAPAEATDGTARAGTRGAGERHHA